MRNEWTTLCEALPGAFATHASRPALDVQGRVLAYDDVWREAMTLKHAVSAVSGPTDGFIAVHAYRSPVAYTGILAVLLSGRGYVPLNPRFPPRRLGRMLELSRCRTLILGEECAESFSAYAAEMAGLTIICPEPGDRCRAVAARLPQHAFVFPDALASVHDSAITVVAPTDPAYLLFTSGSTGTPKGVAINHGNVCAYLRYVLDRYQPAPGDRFSQMFDLTFDLSVHDILVTFLAGACLCVVPESALMAPAKFIRDKAVTFWFSVPSVAMFMARMRMLKPDVFPSLRYALFCGEALPQRTAEAWAAAAPNAIIENLYGPTETTIAITHYRWRTDISPGQCVNGVVPIGWPFAGQCVRIVDSGGQPVLPGHEGELCLAGSQVGPGYLDDPVRTAERFVRFSDEPATVWYRTGDLVREAGDGCLVFLGRIDDQIQIRGYRVEIQEIDKVLREAAGTDLCVAVPLRLAQGRAESVVAVIQGADSEAVRQRVLEACKRDLPDYMVPARVFFQAAMPLNANGKIDRKALGEGVNESSS